MALKKLRKEQELAEKLEMDVVTKRAAWKARVTFPKGILDQKPRQGPGS